MGYFIVKSIKIIEVYDHDIQEQDIQNVGVFFDSHASGDGYGSPRNR